MNTTFHQIEGLKIRVAKQTSGKPITLVMTNALPQSIMCWQSLWERLSEQFDLLAVDMPGFGLSEGSDEVMTPSAQAEFLCKVLDYFGIDKAFGIGPDIGVPIMLSLASQQPDRLLGLNLFDGPGTWRPDFDPSLKIASESPFLRRIVTGWPMRKYFMKGNYKTAINLGYQSFQPSEENQQEYQQICFDKTKHQYAMDFLGSYPTELSQIEKALPNIKLPVLLTWGEKDKFVPPSNGKKLKDRIPNSELTVFKNAGHFSHEDADQLWLDTLVGFIAKQDFQPQVH